LNQTRRTLGIPNDSISPESALVSTIRLRLLLTKIEFDPRL